MDLMQKLNENLKKHRKCFNKIQHIFTVKVLETILLYDTYLKIINTIWEKPRVNIILNGEILNLSYWSWKQDRDVCYVYSLLIFIWHSRWQYKAKEGKLQGYKEKIKKYCFYFYFLFNSKKYHTEMEIMSLPFNNIPKKTEYWGKT